MKCKFVINLNHFYFILKLASICLFYRIKKKIISVLFSIARLQQIILFKVVEISIKIIPILTNIARQINLFFMGKINKLI